LKFFEEIMRGQLPERVIPWARYNIPTKEDMYISSAAYLSILFLSALVSLLTILIWIKENNNHINKSKSVLSIATSTTILLLLGIAAVAYIGASLMPEVPFSDIRTILIASIMLMLPFLFISSELLARINANKLLLTIIVILIIICSLRTFYDKYPKSFYDPVNAVEDIRVDTRAVYCVGDFLEKFKTGGIVAFDYKTGKHAPPSLSRGGFQSSIFTSKLTPSTFVIFDINGLKFGSLYTSREAYSEAYNLTLTQNIIYNNGNITIIQRK